MEPVKEFDLSQFNIDKYLKWYKGLTVALESYPSKKKRLDRLEKVCDYLSKRCFRMILSGHHTFSEKLLESFNKEKEKLYPEVEDLLPYTKEADFLLEESENIFFIPILTDWEYLHFIRQFYLKDRQTEYLKEFQRSILKDRDFARLKLDELSKDIFNSDFYGNVIFSTPILKRIITANSFNDVSGWKFFCHWCCEIDYAKWLLGKTKSQERYESIIKPTNYGVRLLFHYLSSNNGEDLYNPETLEKASTKYALSKARIKRELPNFKPNEITTAGPTTNEKTAKLNDIRFAVQELRKIGNKNATNEALKDLKIIEEKINN